MGQLRVKQVGQFALKCLGHYQLKQVGQLTVKWVGQYGLIYSPKAPGKVSAKDSQAYVLANKFSSGTC